MPPDDTPTDPAPDPRRAVLPTTGDSLRDRLSAITSTAAESVGLIDRDSQADRDRSWIARRIINIFVAAIGLVFFILALQGVLKGEWSAVASQSVELIKTAVLPIVTLVLGFYFGSRAGKG